MFKLALPSMNKGGTTAVGEAIEALRQEGGTLDSLNCRGNAISGKES